MERQQQQQQFLQQAIGRHFTITALPGDASFRRYYRIGHHEQSYLLMDAPPALEDCHGFVAIAQALQHQGVAAPQIFAEDLTQGFLLLEDFGDDLLSQHLTGASVDDLYRQCFEPLLRMQGIQTVANWPLPRFDQALLPQELMNCREWFIEKFLAVHIDASLAQCLQETFELLQQDIQQHPQVFVHRDYHSRNLMVLANGQIGVLDFQDAVTGSIVYDLVSLLRDCYVAWPSEQVQAWVEAFYQCLPQKSDFSLAQFQRWFDWQGLQRHLKCLFIFARKWLRDGSTNYLKDLITTFHYIEQVVRQYSEFKALAAYLPQWRDLMLAKIGTALAIL